MQNRFCIPTAFWDPKVHSFVLCIVDASALCTGGALVRSKKDGTTAGALHNIEDVTRASGGLDYSKI